MEFLSDQSASNFYKKSSRRLFRSLSWSLSISHVTLSTFSRSIFNKYTIFSLLLRITLEIKQPSRKELPPNKPYKHQPVKKYHQFHQPNPYENMVWVHVHRQVNHLLRRVVKHRNNQMFTHRKQSPKSVHQNPKRGKV